MKTKKIINLLFALLLSIGSSFAQSTTCPTDINRDGITNNADYLLLSAAFGQTCPSGTSCPTDINGDGVTNNSDFLLLIGKYGQRCNIVMLNLSNGVFHDGYLDVPVAMSSDAATYALDFAIKFDESKLTFNSMLINDSHIDSYASYFNPNDRTLRFTGNSMQNFQNDVPLVTIRFSTTVTSIATTDFNSIATYLQGNAVGYILKGTATAGSRLNTNSEPVASSSMQADRLFLFPNPASESAKLGFELKEVSSVQIAIYDIQGAHVGESISLTDVAKGYYAHEINTSNMSAGTYFVSVCINGQIYRTKLNVVK